MDIGCETKQDIFCSLCQVNQVPRFTLRGLCQDSKLDSRYVWTGQRVNGKYAFNGYDSSFMQWDKDHLRWVTFNEKDPSIYAYTDTVPYQFEKGTWILINDTCNHVQYSRREATLIFNACQDGQFNCGDSIW